MKTHSHFLLFVFVAASLFLAGCGGTAVILNSTELAPTQPSPTWIPPTEPFYNTTCTGQQNCFKLCKSDFTSFVTPGPYPCEQSIQGILYYGYCDRIGFQVKFHTVGRVTDIHGSIPLTAEPSNVICIKSTPTPLFLPGAIVTPTPTLVFSKPDPSYIRVDQYCVDPKKQIGGATVYYPTGSWAQNYGPFYTAKAVTDLGELNKYFPGNGSADSYTGPAGAQFILWQPLLNLPGQPDEFYKESYGTCGARNSSGGGGGSGGGGSCQEPLGGCPSGQFFVDCSCTTIK